MDTERGRPDPASTIAAVADPGRRTILDLLNETDGRPVKALEQALPHLGRHAVLKHLGVLEDAGLVVTVKSGRQRLCYLNPVPLLDLARHWTTAYSAGWGGRLLALRDLTETPPIERTAMTASRSLALAPDLVQQVVINAPIERVWEAITTQEARRWFFGTAMSTTEAGADYTVDDAEGRTQIRGTIVEADPPRLLVQTYRACWEASVSADPASEVTWRLEERSALTLVTVEHRGVAGTETGRQATGGWAFLLSNLKSYLETGAGMPNGLGSDG